MNSEPNPGIGRLSYFGGNLTIGTGIVLIILAIPRLPMDEIITGLPAFIAWWILTAIAGGLSLTLTALRLENIGKPVWWIGLTFIPIVSIYAWVLLIAAPVGYHHHKKLDTAGGAIIAALAALVTIVIALAILG